MPGFAGGGRKAPGRPPLTAPIPPTIHAAEACDRDWDVAVVGAGVAGGALACALARTGRSVLLLDKSAFPRDKSCGGTLNPRAVRALERMGLGRVPVDAGAAPLSGVDWRTCLGTSAQIGFGPDGGACAVPRRDLDAALVREAIRLGAEFLPASCCTGTTIHGSRRILHVRCREGGEGTFRAKVVAACDGIGSRLAIDAGLARHRRRDGEMLIGASITDGGCAPEGLPHGRIVMCLGREGYAGLVQVGRHGWSLAGAIRVDALQGGHPAHAVRRLVESCGVAVPGPVPQPGPRWTVTRPGLRFDVVRPCADRLLLVGDAAGYAEPISGEGMAWALEDAEVAGALLRSGWSREVEAAWSAYRHRRAAGGRRLALIAGTVARHPLPRELALRAIRWVPSIGRGLVGAVHHGTCHRVGSE